MRVLTEKNGAVLSISYSPSIANSLSIPEQLLLRKDEALIHQWSKLMTLRDLRKAHAT